MEQLPVSDPQGQKQLVQELLQFNLPQFEKDLQEVQKGLQLMPAQMQAPHEFFSPVVQAILSGGQKFTDIRAPILAIFAVPHDLSGMFKDDPAALAAAEAWDAANTEAQVKAFESGLPSVRVVRLPNANHSTIFQSSQDDLLREIDAFLSALP